MPEGSTSLISLEILLQTTQAKQAIRELAQIYRSEIESVASAGGAGAGGGAREEPTSGIGPRLGGRPSEDEEKIRKALLKGGQGIGELFGNNLTAQLQNKLKGVLSGIFSDELRGFGFSPQTIRKAGQDFAREFEKLKFPVSTASGAGVVASSRVAQAQKRAEDAAVVRLNEEKRTHTEATTATQRERRLPNQIPQQPRRERATAPVAPPVAVAQPRPRDESGRFVQRVGVLLPIAAPSPDEVQRFKDSPAGRRAEAALAGTNTAPKTTVAEQVKEAKAKTRKPASAPATSVVVVEESVVTPPVAPQKKTRKPPVGTTPVQNFDEWKAGAAPGSLPPEPPQKRTRKAPAATAPTASEEPVEPQPRFIRLYRNETMVHEERITSPQQVLDVIHQHPPEWAVGGKAYVEEGKVRHLLAESFETSSIKGQTSPRWNFSRSGQRAVKATSLANKAEAIAAGVGFGTGLEEGIKSTTGKVRSAAVTVGKGAVEGVHTALGESFVSREGVAAGEGLDAGLVKGIKAGQAGVVAAAEEVGKVASQALIKATGGGAARTAAGVAAVPGVVEKNPARRRGQSQAEITKERQDAAAALEAERTTARTSALGGIHTPAKLPPHTPAIPTPWEGVLYPSRRAAQEASGLSSGAFYRALNAATQPAVAATAAATGGAGKPPPKAPRTAAGAAGGTPPPVPPTPPAAAAAAAAGGAPLHPLLTAGQRGIIKNARLAAKNKTPLSPIQQAQAGSADVINDMLTRGATLEDVAATLEADQGQAAAIGRGNRAGAHARHLTIIGAGKAPPSYIGPAQLAAFFQSNQATEISAGRQELQAADPEAVALKARQVAAAAVLKRATRLPADVAAQYRSEDEIRATHGTFATHTANLDAAGAVTPRLRAFIEAINATGVAAGQATIREEAFNVAMNAVQRQARNPFTQQAYAALTGRTPTLFQRFYATTRAGGGHGGGGGGELGAFSSPTLGQFAGRHVTNLLGYALPGIAIGGLFEGMRQAITQATEVQRDLAEVQAEFQALGQGNQFSGYVSSIEQISSKTGVAVNKVAELALEMKGVFGSTQQATIALTALAQGSVALNESINTLEESLTAISQAFSPLETQGGKAFTTIQNQALHFQDVFGTPAAQTLSGTAVIGPIANQLGLSQQYTQGLIALGSRQTGLSGQDVGEALLKVLPGISQSSFQLVQQLAPYGKVAQPFVGAVERGNYGAATQALLQLIPKLSLAASGSLITTLGGNPQSRGLLLSLGTSLTPGNVSKINSAVPPDRMAQEFAKQSQTLLQAVKRFGTDLANVGVEILQSGVGTVLEKTVSGIGDFVNVLKEVNDATHGAIGTLTEAAVGFALVGGVIKSIGTTRGIIKNLSGAGTADAIGTAGTGFLAKVQAAGEDFYALVNEGAVVERDANLAGGGGLAGGGAKGLGLLKSLGIVAGIAGLSEGVNLTSQITTHPSGGKTAELYGANIAGGAATGAVIGSFITPGVGTAIGAGIGATAGAAVAAGEQLFAHIESPVNQLTSAVNNIITKGGSAADITKLQAEITALKNEKTPGAGGIREPQTLVQQVRSGKVKDMTVAEAEALQQAGVILPGRNLPTLTRSQTAARRSAAAAALAAAERWDPQGGVSMVPNDPQGSGWRKGYRTPGQQISTIQGWISSSILGLTGRAAERPPKQLSDRQLGELSREYGPQVAALLSQIETNLSTGTLNVKDEQLINAAIAKNPGIAGAAEWSTPGFIASHSIFGAAPTSPGTGRYPNATTPLGKAFGTGYDFAGIQTAYQAGTASYSQYLQIAQQTVQQAQTTYGAPGTAANPFPGQGSQNFEALQTARSNLVSATDTQSQQLNTLANSLLQQGSVGGAIQTLKNAYTLLAHSFSESDIMQAISTIIQDAENVRSTAASLAVSTQSQLRILATPYPLPAAQTQQILSKAAKSIATGPTGVIGAPGTSTTVSNTSSIVAPAAYQSLYAQAAAKYGVPLGLLLAQAQQESGFNPNALSPAGAEGIAQFMPGTAKGAGVNPWNPASAIPGQAKLDRQNYNQFGSWALSLAAYNAGGGNVAKYGGIPPFAQTQAYVKSILGASNLGGTGGTVVSTGDTQRQSEVARAALIATQIKIAKPGQSGYTAKQGEDALVTLGLAHKGVLQDTTSWKKYAADIEKIFADAGITSGEQLSKGLIQGLQGTGKEKTAAAKRVEDMIKTLPQGSVTSVQRSQLAAEIKAMTGGGVLSYNKQGQPVITIPGQKQSALTFFSGIQQQLQVGQAAAVANADENPLQIAALNAAYAKQQYESYIHEKHGASLYDEQAKTLHAAALTAAHTYYDTANQTQQTIFASQAQVLASAPTLAAQATIKQAQQALKLAQVHKDKGGIATARGQIAAAVQAGQQGQVQLVQATTASQVAFLQAAGQGLPAAQAQLGGDTQAANLLYSQMAKQYKANAAVFKSMHVSLADFVASNPAYTAALGQVKTDLGAANQAATAQIQALGAVTAAEKTLRGQTVGAAQAASATATAVVKSRQSFDQEQFKKYKLTHPSATLAQFYKSDTVLQGDIATQIGAFTSQQQADVQAAQTKAALAASKSTLVGQTVTAAQQTLGGALAARAKFIKDKGDINSQGGQVIQQNVVTAQQGVQQAVISAAQVAGTIASAQSTLTGQTVLAAQQQQAAALKALRESGLKPGSPGYQALQANYLSAQQGVQQARIEAVQTAGSLASAQASLGGQTTQAAQDQLKAAQQALKTSGYTKGSTQYKAAQQNIVSAHQSVQQAAVQGAQTLGGLLSAQSSLQGQSVLAAQQQAAAAQQALAAFVQKGGVVGSQGYQVLQTAVTTTQQGAQQARIQAAQTSSGLAAAQDTLRGQTLKAAQDTLAGARAALTTSKYKKGSTQYQAQLTNVVSAHTGVIQAHFQSIQATQALATATAFEDPQAIAKAGLVSAQAQLKAAHTKVGSTEWKTLRAAVLTGQHDVFDTTKAVQSAQATYLQQLFSNDPIKAAEEGVKAADIALQAAHGKAARYAAMGQRVQAINQEYQAQSDLLVAQSNVQAALANVAGTPYQAALASEAGALAAYNTEIKKDIALGYTPAMIRKDTTALNDFAAYQNAKANSMQALVSQDENVVQSRLTLGQITTQQAIAVLYADLAKVKGNQQETLALEVQIRQLMNSTGNLSFNLPTTLVPSSLYQARLAEATGGRMPAGNTYTFNVNVNANSASSLQNFTNTVKNVTGAPANMHIGW